MVSRTDPINRDQEQTGGGQI